MCVRGRVSSGAAWYVRTVVRTVVLIVLSCDKTAGLILIVIGYHEIQINTGRDRIKKLLNKKSRP